MKINKTFTKLELVEMEKEIMTMSLTDLAEAQMTLKQIVSDERMLNQVLKLIKKRFNELWYEKYPRKEAIMNGPG